MTEQSFQPAHELEAWSFIQGRIQEFLTGGVPGFSRKCEVEENFLEVVITERRFTT